VIGALSDTPTPPQTPPAPPSPAPSNKPSPPPGGGETCSCLLTMHWDHYSGEAAFNIYDENMNDYFGGWVESGDSSVSYAGDTITDQGFEQWDPSASSPYTDGYRFWASVEMPDGTYTVVMTDTWGDGWEYTTSDGSDAFVLSGCGDLTIPFASGSSASGTFTLDTCSAGGAAESPAPPSPPSDRVFQFGSRLRGRSRPPPSPAPPPPPSTPPARLKKLITTGIIVALTAAVAHKLVPASPAPPPPEFSHDEAAQ